MNPYILNLIGLIADIIGVLGLFKYGLPSKVIAYEGDSIVDAPDPKKAAEIAKRNGHIECMANWSLGFIIAGFVFQFVSNCIFMAR